LFQEAKICACANTIYDVLIGVC